MLGRATRGSVDATTAAIRHVYLQVRACSASELDVLIGMVGSLATVRSKGVGPESDRAAAWCELRLRKDYDTLAVVRAQLVRLGVEDSRIGDLRVIAAGEGRTQTKQIPLFGGA